MKPKVVLVIRVESIEFPAVEWKDFSSCIGVRGGGAGGQLPPV